MGLDDEEIAGTPQAEDHCPWPLQNVHLDDPRHTHTMPLSGTSSSSLIRIR